ncbi:hypothetical protein EXIGLDRAFT_136981 [Exidia glandulosa HHB12029]|uniref:Zinc finger PHD-type domain-containing protein n=1 Tax=Exidia glandulosa HHB12029 TaxID=1314781 RepID=A0A165G1K3_EXIGL|nr:hypothetical protein EXIGLDRAFT_136981 [Exidia glandulosa HHB12029]
MFTRIRAAITAFLQPIPLAPQQPGTYSTHPMPLPAGGNTTAPILLPVYDEDGQLIGYRQAPSQPSTAAPSQSRTKNPQKHSDPAGTATLSPVSPWNHWPDGYIQCDIALEAKQLPLVHWSHRQRGGSKKGSESAESAADGKPKVFDCLGCVQCSNPECAWRDRVRTRSKSRSCQDTCGECGSQAILAECDARWTFTVYAGGNRAQFIHEGRHTHPRHREQHLTAIEEQQLSDRVELHPNAAPLAHIAGIPTLSGSLSSVGDIAPILLNPDRLRYHTNKIKRHASTKDRTSGQHFLTDMKEFDQQYPGLLVNTKIGAATVFCMQSAFMRDLALRDKRLPGPLNAHVTDACHGFWRAKNDVLIISSAYSERLRCWMPIVLSYSDGQTAEHYAAHFEAYFDGLAAQAEVDNVIISDDLFRNTVDFSQAQRRGFIIAFVRFWQKRNSHRSAEELEEAAVSLLRGCGEHFRSSITRVTHSAKLFPAANAGRTAEAFTQLALSLLWDIPQDEYHQRVKNIHRLYPALSPWLEWWTRPTVAPMIFPAVKSMADEDWAAMPATSNAEESQHNVIKTLVGKSHHLLDGLRAMVKVTRFYEQKMLYKSTGGKIRHGRPEPWKVRKLLMGHTKKSRTKRSQNSSTVTRKRTAKRDYRPPDTVKDLLRKPRARRKRTQKVHSDSDYNPGRSKTQRPAAAPIKSVPRSLPQTEKGQPRSISTKNDKTYGRPKDLPSSSSESSDSESSVARHHTSVAIRIHTRAYGPQWSRNSCWLDTAWQLLYYASSYDMQLLATFAANAPPSGLVAQFMRFLKNRHELHSQHDSNSISQSLTHQRDQLRDFIVSYTIGHGKAARMPGGSDTVFGWFFDLAIAESKTHPESFQSAAYIAGMELSFAICQHGRAGQSHISISLPSPWRASLRHSNDNPRIHSLFGGDIQKWVTSRMQLAVEVGCPAQSEASSDLPAIRYQPWVEVPLMLAIDYEVPFSKMEWTLPCVLHPLGKDVGRDDELVYDLVGVAVAKGSDNCAHFVAYFRHPDGTAFHYDGMENGGTPTRSNHPLDDATLGQIIRNFNIAGAVYRLRGGRSAQTAFFQHQAEILATEYGVIIERLPDVSGHSIELNSQRWEHLGHTDSGLHGTAAAAGPAIEPQPASSTTGPQRALIAAPKRPRAAAASPKPPPAKRQRTTPSPDTLSCRCQATVFDADMGPTIPCMLCGQHSHLSCLPGGYVPLSLKPSEFKCHSCKSMTSERLMTQLSQQLMESMKAWDQKPLNKRLHPGMAALACYSVDGKPCKYWYPVRLIGLFNKSKKTFWRVSWWPHSSFVPAGHQPETLVPIKFVVDALMGDQQRRRSIRLGKWKVASNPDALDPLYNFRAHPYTPEVDALLQPHKETLKQLALLHPAKRLLDYLPTLSKIPVLGHQVDTRQLPKAIGWGNLPPLTTAHICYWVSIHIDRNVNVAGMRMLFHAANIALAAHNNISLADAWQRFQIEFDGLSPRSSIDTFALNILEQRMFDQSASLGPAALSQWGLDVGDHQQRWNPYEEGPTHDEHTAAGWDGDSDEYALLLTVSMPSPIEQF